MEHAARRNAHMDAQLITKLRSDRGTTLVETLIATSLLLVVMAGLLSLVALATAYTENHGHLEARATEYAQDKMEQLLALSYGDAVTDTVVFPAIVTGAGTGMAIGGGTNTTAPVAGYVDWLANDGTLLGGGAAPPATWFYERVWQVTSPLAGIKQITVTATVKASVGNMIIPTSTVVALKSSQF